MTSRLIYFSTPSLSRPAFHALLAQAFMAASIHVTEVDYDAEAVQSLLDADAAFRAGRMREITRYPNTSRNSRRKRAQWKNETDKRGRSR